MEDKRTKVSNAVYQIWSAGIAVCVVLFGIGKFVGIGNPSIVHVLLACVVVFVFAGMQYLPGRGRVILLCGVIAVSGILLWYIGRTQMGIYLQNYLDWLGNGHHWQKEWVGGYTGMQAVIIAVCCYVYELAANRNRMVKRLTAGILMGYLLIMMFGKQSVSHAGVISILGYFLFALVEWTQERWDKNKIHSIRQHMIWISPFLVLYLVLLCVMPYSEEKFEWTFLKDATEKIKEVVINLASEWNIGGGTEFAVAMSGYSEENSLQGEVQLSEQKVMQVKRSGTGSENLYLAGIVNDSFDGRQWYTEWDIDNRQQLMDCLETLYAVMMYDSDNRDDYMRSTKLKVRYQNISTRALFIPQKMRSLYVGKNRQNLSLTENSLSRGAKRKYGTEYEITYYRMNLGNEIFDNLFEEIQRTQAGLTEEEKEELWKSAVSHYAGGGMEIPFAELEEYRSVMKLRYVQDVLVSEEVQEWLNQVTGSEDSNIGKLRKLEEALSDYQYTLSPGMIPEDVQSVSDFLDYFLLEKKEGYCTYFATAFVLLARAEGIPARYVQGYCVPIKNQEVQVYNTMAHAWPEAYIEGVGWIPFEPTPGRREYRYVSWKTKEERLQSGIMNRPPDMTPENLPVQEEESLPVEEEELVQGNRLFSMLGVAAGTFLLLVVLFLALDRLVRKYRYKKMAPSERYRARMQRNLRLLFLLGIRREEAETLQELNSRIEQRYEILLKSMESYEQFLYGDREVSQQMMDEVEEDREQIGKQIKEIILSKIHCSCVM